MENGVESEDELPIAHRRSKLSSPRDNLSAPISLTLLDRELFDCSICFEPLQPPIFQCENGHLCCSSCCTKLKNKCAFCNSPIGSKRVRFVEKVLESVMVSCQNVEYGCQKTLLYNQKSIHEKSCIYIPCSCPLLECNYTGSFEQLYKHWSGKHKDSGINFAFDEKIWIILKREEQFFYHQEERDGSLFVVYNKVESIGNVVTVSRIGPSDESRYEFEYSASIVDPYFKISLQSTEIENLQDLERIQNMKAVLVIPTRVFLSCSGQLKSQLSIRPLLGKASEHV